MRDQRDTRNFPTILRLPFKMPGDFCILCGNSLLKATADRQVSYHRFPKTKENLHLWLQAFQLSAEQMKSHSRARETPETFLLHLKLSAKQMKGHSRVSPRHFRGGDPKNGPEPALGRRFASPTKKDAPRAKRAKLRQESRDYQKACSSQSVTSTPSLLPSPFPTLTVPPLTVAVGEQLHMDYQLHELPSECVQRQHPV